MPNGSPEFVYKSQENVLLKYSVVVDISLNDLTLEKYLNLTDLIS